MSYYLAPALTVLRDEVNARWPSRSKASDGWIGDPAHSARVSDHNPNGRGSVNALDVTASGIDADVLIAAAMRHPSTRYIIHRGQIRNRDIGNWRPRRYTGSNPHDTHVHISIYQTATAEQRGQSWGLGAASTPKPTPKPGTAPPWPFKPTEYLGPEGRGPNSISGYHRGRAQVRQYQQQMRDRGWSRMSVDGYYGQRGQTHASQSITGDITMQFQREKGLTVDGWVGPQTWAAAWEEPIT